MFLTDDQLSSLLATTPGIFENLRREPPPYAEDDPIQPCSVDLTIGAIYTPGGEKATSTRSPRTEFSLGSGQTAVVETLEIINFPDHIGAIGFPPASVSSSGLLTTNPGHVDPGYKGPMSFTVINMGREPYLLRKGERIVTLLPFELGQPVGRDWAKRKADRPGPSPEKRRKDLLGKLSPDFLNVTQRAEEVAASEERRARTFTLVVPTFVLILTIVLTLVTAMVTASFTTNDDIDKLSTRASLLEHEIGDGKTGKTFEQRVKDLEASVKKLRHRKTP